MLKNLKPVRHLYTIAVPEKRSHNDFHARLSYDFQVIQNAPKLKHLSVARCSLQNSALLAGTAKMDVFSNAFQILTPNTFYIPSRIMELEMSNNRLRKIECLVNMTRLKRLHLSSNRLTAVPDGVFNESMKLEELYLSENQLRCVEGLKDLTKLRTLTLDSNRLSSLPGHVFKKLNRLQTLNLANNSISVLTDLPKDINLVSFIFRGNVLSNVDFYHPLLKKVSHVINLDGNPVGHVNISGISIESLYLVNCRINTIHAIQNMTRLRDITLSINQITQLTEDVVFHLPALYCMIIKDNHLTRVPRIHLPSLYFLNLYRNRISTLAIEDLQGLPNLRELNLGYNYIGVISNLSHAKMTTKVGKWPFTHL